MERERDILIIKIYENKKRKEEGFRVKNKIST
jgi:hypothetical protein